MDYEKIIAITIQNLVQFYSMKNGIDALVAKGYLVDIYVPISEDNLGFGNMFNETYCSLVALGYSPLRTVDSSKRYKILLEPYPMDDYIKFNFKYRIKYKYSLISAKPNLVYKPESNIYYDAILCYGPYEANYLKVYSDIELIGNLKYLNFKKTNNIVNTNKKILLYLPTYGDVSSIDSILESLNKLKEKYYIITKLHHGTSFLNAENNRITKLRQFVDEYYDHKTELAELLSKVDVVLSDNSGSIFEAIYAKVPVAIYSTDINKNKLKNFDTIQYKLVENGYIPYSNNAYEIKNILDKALSENCIQKQNELRKHLFYLPENPLDSFINAIEKYLNDNINHDYKNLHDVLIEDYHTKTTAGNEITNLEYSIKKYQEELLEKDLLIDNYKKQLDNKNLIIDYYEKGKLYKVSKNIYKLYYKLKKKE